MATRAALTAGLVLTAPLAFSGLVLLPVGIVVQVGSQSRLRVENRSDRTVRITPLGTRKADGRRAVLRQAISTLLPLPALRGADLPLEPGAVRDLHFRPGDYRPTELLVRDAAGDVRQLVLADSGRVPQRIPRWDDLPRASPDVVAAAAGNPQLLPWTAVLVSLGGLLAFVKLLRLRRRQREGP
jgi:hypothetical protein